jgi:type IV pilus biogenesis protein CpaD/CtpE
MVNVESSRRWLIVAAIMVLCSGCASTSSDTRPRSPSQVKQQELLKMENQGQRNDIDHPFK